MADNLWGPTMAGKTINVPHTEDFLESESQVDESFFTVTVGADGKIEVAGTMKTAILEHYEADFHAI